MRLRRVLFVIFVALAVPVGAASLAYACTALATLTVTSGAAGPGQTISGTGKGFNGGLHGADPATATKVPVEMRWNSRSGPVVGSFVPSDTAGNLVFSFAAPNVPPGQYVLIGVQNDPKTGNPFYGTPARQTVTIAAAGSRTDLSRADGAAAGTVAESPVASDQPATAPVAGTPAATTAQPGQVTPAPATGTKALTGAASRQGGEGSSLGAAATTAESAAGVEASAATSTPAVRSEAGSAEPGSVTTATPGLISDAGGRGAAVPGALLILLGLGLSLTVSVRWITGRLPQLRGSAA